MSDELEKAKTWISGTFDVHATTIRTDAHNGEIECSTHFVYQADVFQLQLALAREEYVLQLQGPSTNDLPVPLQNFPDDVIHDVLTRGALDRLLRKLVQRVEIANRTALVSQATIATRRCAQAVLSFERGYSFASVLGGVASTSPYPKSQQSDAIWRTALTWRGHQISDRKPVSVWLSYKDGQLEEYQFFAGVEKYLVELETPRSKEPV